MRRNHVIRFLFFLTLVSFVVILLSGTVNAGSTRQEGNAAYSHNDDYSLCALPSGCTASQSTGTEPDDHNSGTSIRLSPDLLQDGEVQYAKDLGTIGCISSSHSIDLSLRYDTRGYGTPSNAGSFDIYSFGSSSWQGPTAIPESNGFTSRTFTASHSYLSSNGYLLYYTWSDDDMEIDYVDISWTDSTTPPSAPTITSNGWPSGNSGTYNGYTFWDDYILSSASLSHTTTPSCPVDYHQYKWTSNPAPGSNWCTASSVSSSNLQTTTSSTIPQKYFANGNYCLQVRAVDENGNIGGWSTEDYHIDATDPTVSLSGWTASDWFNDGSCIGCSSTVTNPLPTIRWTGQDSTTAIDSYSVDIGGTTRNCPQSSSATSCTPSQYGSVSSGTHSVVINAQDVVQNTGSDSKTLRFDNTPPTTTTLNNQFTTGWLSDTTLLLSWPSSTDSHSGVAEYKLHINGGTPISAGSSTSKQVNAGLNSGTNTIIIETCDLAGNCIQGSSATIQIDVTSPTLGTPSSSSHSSGTWSGSNSISASVTATDTQSNVDKVYFFLSQQSSGVSASTVVSNAISNSNVYNNCGSTSSCIATMTLTISGPNPSSGYYYLWVVADDKAVDTNGNSDPNREGPRISSSLWIDLQAPSQPGAPIIQNLVNGYLGSSNASFSWSAATDAHSGVVSYRYIMRLSSSSAIPSTSTTSLSGSWSSLVDGQTYQMCVLAVDDVSNVGDEICSSQFTVSTTPPTLVWNLVDGSGNNISNPSSYWFDSSAVTFVWSASDSASGITSVQYRYRSGSNSWTSNYSLATSSGSGNHTLTLTSGNYSLEVSALNGVYTPASSQATFNVDINDPHSLSLSSTVPGWANNSVNIISWSAIDTHSGVQDATLLWASDNSIVTMCGSGWSSPCVGGGGTNSASGFFVVSLPAGNHTFLLRVCDNVGHCTETTNQLIVQVDLGVPTCSISVNPASWTSSTPEVIFSSSLGGSISSVTTSFLWTSSGAVIVDSTLASSPYSLTGASDGVHEIKVVVMNEARASQICSVTAYKDASQPDSLSDIAGIPQYSTSNDILPISFDARDQHSGLSTVKYFIDNVLVHEQTSVQSPSDTTSITISKDINIANSLEGTHDLRIELSDHAGNIRSETHNFIIDRTAPAIEQFHAPGNSPDRVYDEDGANLNWLVTDDWPEGMSIELLVDGNLKATGLSSSENAYYLLLNTGNYQVKIRATDAAGNSVISDSIELTYYADLTPTEITCYIGDELVGTEGELNHFLNINSIICIFVDESIPIYDEAVVMMNGAPIGSDYYSGEIGDGIRFAYSHDVGPYDFSVQVENNRSLVATYSAVVHMIGEPFEVKSTGDLPTTPGISNETIYVVNGHTPSLVIGPILLDGVEIHGLAELSATTVQFNLNVTPGQHNLSVTVRDDYRQNTTIISFNVSCPDGEWNDTSFRCELPDTGEVDGGQGEVDGSQDGGQGEVDGSQDGGQNDGDSGETTKESTSSSGISWLSLIIAIIVSVIATVIVMMYIRSRW